MWFLDTRGGIVLRFILPLEQQGLVVGEGRHRLVEARLGRRPALCDQSAAGGAATARPAAGH